MPLLIRLLSSEGTSLRCATSKREDIILGRILLLISQLSAIGLEIHGELVPDFVSITNTFRFSCSSVTHPVSLIYPLELY